MDKNKRFLLFLLLIFYLVTLYCFIFFIGQYYLQGIPHVPDDVAYLFMAKMFALGYIIMPIPASPENFNFFPGILNTESGKWLFQYPFGHPMLLALGVLIGFPGLIPPFIGTAVVIIIFLISKNLYDLKTALLFLPLPFMSPFFLFNSASFMSHNTASLYLVTAFFLLVLSLQRRNLLFLFGAGIFIGLLFNTRPLTSLPYLLIFMLLLNLKRKSYPRSFMPICIFAAGFMIMFALWLWYNFVTSGNPFSSQYFLVNQNLFEFGQTLSVSQFLNERLLNVSILFQNLFPMLYNLPPFLSLLIPAVPFLSRKNIFWDNFFFFCLISLPIAYFFL